MSLFDQTSHQKKQIEVINGIDNQINSNNINFSTVEPLKDFENDPRLCLTGVHFPTQELINTIYQTLINPLQIIFPDHYYYEKTSLHLTVKSIRIINNPLHFNEVDIQKAKNIFEQIIPKYKKYQVYFYRLLLFPSNLALIGTTDSELDSIVLDLDTKLKNNGIPDDKQYANSQYFFCNMTLARFNSELTADFKNKVKELSQNISIKPYTIDSVTLLAGNAVLKKQKIIDKWNLDT